MNHLHYAHLAWEKHLKTLITKNPQIIDATAGNGHDTLKLAQTALTSTSGNIHTLDIQKTALQSTQDRINKHLSKDLLNRIELYHQSHETFPECISHADLIVYNLGYLPGGDKSLTTTAESTQKSLKSALSLLSPGGLISITFYPGHPPGLVEKNKIPTFLAALDPLIYSLNHIEHPVKLKSPSVMLLQRLFTLD